MALLIGALLALGVGVFATGVGLDRDRSFYPVVMIVIAILYVLFAVMGGSTHALLWELVLCVAFCAMAVIGFKGSLWVVVAALAAHGVQDSFHTRVIANPGVPSWWPGFCLTYDVVAAGYLAWLLRGGRLRARL
ncbi:MAG TPA: hypothetical protein VJ505_00570 [Holophagaceae bacterium]|nr:hypothetical protein [Holophagaceae bacterium]